MNEKTWRRRQSIAWAERLTAARKAKFDTRDQFARFLQAEYGLVVSATAVGMWERGETMPSDYHRIFIARALGRHEAEMFAYTIAVPQVAA